ncbi:hypothetical protein DY000_02015930 [Brassica cretica]|uniref:Uncharacterized protein n=1 Tax=Brassica cretica TaxID=69181 RepID=A0ABQ7CXC7_BRACR|nr:hypothetical protein DY000_02015930 [Brassica cretica]
MSSKRKSSTKSRRDRFVPDGSSSQHAGVVPKVEFSADSIDPEEIDAYWMARGEVKPPLPVLWVPPPFKSNPVAGCPSRSGEVAQSPPEGYFTCYEHLVGILVLSYEMGITLDADHREALVEPRWSASLIVQVRPRTNMAIISGFVSKYHFLKEQFFFVRVSDASVECPPLSIRFPRDCSPFESYYTGVHAFGRTFPRNGSCHAVALYRSRFQPDLLTEEGSDSSMDGFIPYVPQSKRDRLKPRKDKHLMVDEDVVDGQLSPDNILKPAKAVASNLTSTAEVADKEIARLKDELEISLPRERESSEKEVNHAYRRGKREIVEVMKSRRDKFSQKFGELKGRYKALADYRECRGTVGGLYLTQLPDYSFSNEYAKQTGHMAEKDKDFKISEVEEDIWEQWEPVPVSPDTVEAETGDLGEAGEVDQPVAPLDVNDYSIGISMSGDFDLGD